MSLFISMVIAFLALLDGPIGPVSLVARMHDLLNRVNKAEVKLENSNGKLETVNIPVDEYSSMLADPGLQVDWKLVAAIAWTETRFQSRVYFGGQWIGPCQLSPGAFEKDKFGPYQDPNNARDTLVVASMYMKNIGLKPEQTLDKFTDCFAVGKCGRNQVYNQNRRQAFEVWRLIQILRRIENPTTWWLPTNLKSFVTYSTWWVPGRKR